MPRALHMSQPDLAQFMDPGSSEGICVTESGSAPLNTMKLVELRAMAQRMGLKGTSSMRKSEIIAVLSGGSPNTPAPTKRAHAKSSEPSHEDKPPHSSKSDEPARKAPQPKSEATQDSNDEREPVAEADQKTPSDDSQAGGKGRNRRRRNKERDPAAQEQVNEEVGERLAAAMGHSGGGTQPNRDVAREQSPSPENPPRFDDDQSGGSRRARRRRNRDRQNRRNRGGNAMERFDNEPQISDDDVLVPVSGIVDIHENYAFVRTSGYLSGPNDAYLPMSLVKKFGLRRGDVVAGAVRQPREGERKERYNPLVKLDSVNGDVPERAVGRPDFSKLTPLYPQSRLRLETVSNQLTGRIIDLVSPIGKGQRGLIVSPPKAGKTMVMQNIANAIAANNPEVHLMVVLVDERPEEVTDFQRTVSGEVIASTFDRPAEDHTKISELAIERAKRLVELGHDVVILLDGITRLGRAYNLAAPASGRILSGGVDSAALYPPKKFFGAARNIENGGSLTILATALIETGSRMDEVIFEEFKGTGNMELRLRREFADKRIFPAIDVDASGTRREDLLLGRDELGIIWKLRRALSGLEDQQALETLLSRMKKTENNHDFLLSVLKTTPAQEN